MLVSIDTIHFGLQITLAQQNSISLSLLDPNRLCDYINRIRNDGNAIQALCDMAVDNDFPNVIDLAGLSEVRRLFKISDDEKGLVVFNLVQMLRHHPKYVKHGEDLAAVQTDALRDIAFMGMSVNGQWAGVQIHKNHGGPDDHYPIVLCHPALDGVYEQVKDLISSGHNYTAITHVDEKPTAAVGSRQDNLNSLGLTRPKITHLKTQIPLGEYTLEEGNEIKDKAKTILVDAKKECKVKGLAEPSADDMKYVWEQKKLRLIRERKGSHQSKPAGFVNLEAYGLDLPEFATDSSNPMVLETIASSESEEDGKMSAEELAASASTSANVAGRKRKNMKSNTSQFALSSDQMEMIQSLHSAEAAIAAGEMNADEVFPNDAAVSNVGMASANPSNYAEVQIEQSTL